MAACFFVELGYAKPNAQEVLKGLFVPQLKGDGATGLAISLLGAMVMPHNLFLHSALVLSRKVPRSVHGIKEACRFYTIESAFALAIAFLINISIICVSGAVCDSANLDPEDQMNCRDLDLNKASFLLKGFLDLRIAPWIRNMLTRSLAIVPSLIVALIGGSAGAGKLIIIASMILSFELPFALIPLLKFTSSKTKMGTHVNSITISAFTWIISSLIMAINTYYIISGFIKLLLKSGLPTVSKVFAGIFGFAGMSIYLAAILYLVIRKNRKVIQTSLPSDAELGETRNNSHTEANNSIYNLPREDIVSMQLPQSRLTLDLD